MDQSMSQIENVDQVFAALDNRRIGIGPDSWIAQVFAVYLSSGNVWVQVAPKEHPDESVILQLPRTSTTGQGALALRKWAETPDALRSRRVAATSVRTH